MVRFEQKGFTCLIALSFQGEIEVLIMTVPIVDRPDLAGIVCNIHLAKRVSHHVGAKQIFGRARDDIEHNEIGGWISNENLALVPPPLHITL